MRKLVLFLGISLFHIFIYGQTGEAIYSLSGNDINVANKFVDAFFIEKGNAVVLTPYVLKQTETVIASSSYGSFSLKRYKFNGYEHEPGYNVIELLKDGVSILELKSSNGFEPISSYVKSEVGFYSLITLASNTYALIFNEYIYESSPYMVSIVLIRNGQAKLVYNKRMYINSISKQSGSFSMQLQANTVEYIGNNPINQAELHTVWWDGSTLRYQ